MEDHRSQLESSLKECLSAIEGLDRLRNRMNGDVFDDEDRDQVSVVMRIRQTACEELRQKLETLDAQEKALAKLRDRVTQTLRGREAILDTENEVLMAHPELLAKFAKKQLEIEKIISDAVVGSSQQNR